nr:T9SS type A sorting domain-containing protein [Salinivirgaceae bacterium]
DTRIYPMPLTSGQEWHIQGLQANDRVLVYNTNMQVVNNHRTLDKGIYYVVINNRKAHKIIVQ